MDPGSNVTEVNVANLNALFPILFTDLGISIEINLDDSNALFPILFNEESASNVTDTMKNVLANAFSPILITDLGISIEVNPES